MGLDIFRTSCPRDCFSSCTMKVYVEDGRIVKLEGDGVNRATGGKLCVKGMSYKDYVYSPNRVRYPMMRKGERGKGDYERVSWEAAIKAIASSLSEIKAKYGPLGIMHYSSGGGNGLLSQYYKGFFSQMGGYSTTRGNLCYSAGIEATKATYGEVKHNAPWDLENASLIILWGKNPANTNVQEMSFINSAINKGAKLITIDPIRNASSNKSDLHISPAPGTDMALALCVMNILIENGYIDREFVSLYTIGFDKLKEHVKPYNAHKVSDICGIPVKDIYSMVDLIKENKPMTLICGYGVQRYENGGQTVRAISMLPAITGDVGIKGGGFRFANKQWKFNWPYQMGDASKIRDDYPASMLSKALDEYNSPEVKMLWIERANPLTMNPDTNILKKSMEKLDSIVVVDQFYTDTARFADIILPAQSFFEYDDIFSGYWTPYINYFSKIIEPFYEAKNESQIYRMLGEYMGLSIDYLPEYNDDTLNEILQYSQIPIDTERLKEGPYTDDEREIAFKDRKFKTPSGKIEFYSKDMEEKWKVSPIPEYISKGKEAYPLRFLSTHARERIHSQFNDIDCLKAHGGGAVLYINEKDAHDRNIKNGDRIIVFNSRGEIAANAHICDFIKERVVNIYEGLPEESGASVNKLTKAGKSDIGYGAVYYDCYVEVKKCPQ